MTCVNGSLQDKDPKIWGKLPFLMLRLNKIWISMREHRLIKGPALMLLDHKGSAARVVGLDFLNFLSSIPSFWAWGRTLLEWGLMPYSQTRQVR